ncbi:hypothetical protein BC831DRAFT_454345, partial [Entophlyctis helioformis]
TTMMMATILTIPVLHALCVLTRTIQSRAAMQAVRHGQPVHGPAASQATPTASHWVTMKTHIRTIDGCSGDI